MIGLLLLATGASTRLGQPKQLLHFQGQTLIERSIHTALATDVSERLVVLGAHAAQIMPEIVSLNIEKVTNPYWEEGIASSIRLGVKQLVQKRPDLEAVVIMHCDQPSVTPALLNQLIEVYRQTAMMLVVSADENMLGVPALFAHGTFYKLLALQGDKGAESLIPDYEGQTGTIPFPQGQTLEDYQE